MSLSPTSSELTDLDTKAAIILCYVNIDDMKVQGDAQNILLKIIVQKSQKE